MITQCNVCCVDYSTDDPEAFKRHVNCRIEPSNYAKRHMPQYQVPRLERENAELKGRAEALATALEDIKRGYEPEQEGVAYLTSRDMQVVADAALKRHRASKPPVPAADALEAAGERIGTSPPAPGSAEKKGLTEESPPFPVPEGSMFFDGFEFHPYGISHSLLFDLRAWEDLPADLKCLASSVAGCEFMAVSMGECDDATASSLRDRSFACFNAYRVASSSMKKDSGG